MIAFSYVQMINGNQMIVGDLLDKNQDPARLRLISQLENLSEPNHWHF